MDEVEKYERKKEQTLIERERQTKGTTKESDGKARKIRSKG